MQPAPLTQIAKWIDHDLADSVAVRGVAIDTRCLKPGELFVALKGEVVDGHDFVEKAMEAGAAAALVERRVGCNLPQIVVEDSRAALGVLAKRYFEQFNIRSVALTGSCGKTTTKEMIASILQQVGPTLSTEGNLNNDLGVPLTLLEANKEHQFAVVEMGANHVGEIGYLASLLKPEVALITLVAPVHVEGFGSVEGVAKAKGEIWTGLRENGTAVFHTHSPWETLWQPALKDKRVVKFGKDNSALFRAEGIHTNDLGCVEFELVTPVGKVNVSLSIPGEHMAMNGLAAAACAMSLMDLEGPDAMAAVKQGLSLVQPVKGRMNLRAGIGGATVLDDTYNANELAVKAAIDFVVSRPGESIVVFGDMGELGDLVQSAHEAVGVHAKTRGIRHFFTLGEASEWASKAYGEGARHFTDVESLVTSLKPFMQSSTNLLVKGSRFMKMERVVDALVAE